MADFLEVKALNEYYEGMKRKRSEKRKSTLISLSSAGLSESDLQK